MLDGDLCRDALIRRSMLSPRGGCRTFRWIVPDGSDTSVNDQNVLGRSLRVCAASIE
jgi:hypothetical protein